MNCPACGAEMESGHVNAAVCGIAWLKRPSVFWLTSKDAEPLQTDWMGLRPFRICKSPLPSARCRACRLVMFWHLPPRTKREVRIEWLIFLLLVTIPVLVIGAAIWLRNAG
jgi:hypothetical protein